MPMPANYVTTQVVYGSDQQSPFVNVLYHVAADPPTTPSHELAAVWLTVVSDLMAEALRPCLPVTSNVFGVYSVMTTPDGSYSASNGYSTSKPGEVSGDECADYVAALIQKRTPNGTRSGRGRWYVGCVPELFTNTNWLTEDAIFAYEVLAGVWGGSHTAGGCQWDAHHRSKELDGMMPIVAHPVQAMLATMRRRKFRSLV